MILSSRFYLPIKKREDDSPIQEMISTDYQEREDDS